MLTTEKMMLATDIFNNVIAIIASLISQNSAYCFDYIKLHKLLFLAECYINYKYGISLVKLPIIANEDGPYIPEAYDFVFNRFGPDNINENNIKEYLTEKVVNGQSRAIIELTHLRRELLKEIIKYLELVIQHKLLK